MPPTMMAQCLRQWSCARPLHSETAVDKPPNGEDPHMPGKLATTGTRWNRSFCHAKAVHRSDLTTIALRSASHCTHTHASVPTERPCRGMACDIFSGSSRWDLRDGVSSVAVQLDRGCCFCCRWSNRSSQVAQHSGTLCDPAKERSGCLRGSHFPSTARA